ncbi:hypothetical protein FDP41_013182 [Naegleria fowleri]|uniref:Translation initiation factor beta propellor-like domain-containing protein n=1 Tax=Naegleria fowleri TaxID=5763 RepID=A0A6A5C5W2_NAEFO|nr:uncharacterized protein FDP41_013182 [Naegleria fowleri]KAF0980699.1 hypothetical protein FDP41_013182 [Naegleria fowleri]CAG4714857.1 unnamed protein product [Naegleria fowleri]
MDFSEVFKYSGICKFSPNGKYIASSAGYKLVITDVESLQVLRFYTCSDVISQIDWSSDSEFVLCAQYKRSCVEVWSVSDNTWKCKIEEGPAGVSFARFSPDARHVLVTADFQLRITIWSLKNSSLNVDGNDEFSGHVAHIKYPKYTSKGLDFTPNGGKYMALAERRDCKDYISIIVTETWELVKHFPVRTKNLTDIKWSPDGRYLVVWDHPLDYSVTIYSPAGSEISHYSAYNDLLGVKTVKWSPNGQLLAIGSFDQKARLLNHLTWNLTGTYEHASPVSLESHPNNPVVFQEVEFVGSKNTTHSKTRYVIAELPVQIKSLKNIDYKKANPQEGIGLMDWSCDSKYLCTRNDSMPNTLWIWETSKLSLCSLVIQTQPIRQAQWDPVHPRLAICTGNGKIYIWSKEGCSCVDVPSASFNVQNFRWNSDGESMLLMDSGSFCVCYPSIDSC